VALQALREPRNIALRAYAGDEPSVPIVLEQKVSIIPVYY